MRLISLEQNRNGFGTEIGIKDVEIFNIDVNNMGNKLETRMK
jgi:hypothetical protein